jgi:hypothetical protein
MAVPGLIGAGAQPAAAGPSADRIMQLGLGFMASRTLLSAAELGVFTRLVNDPIGVAYCSRREEWYG